MIKSFSKTVLTQFTVWAFLAGVLASSHVLAASEQASKPEKAAAEKTKEKAPLPPLTWAKPNVNIQHWRTANGAAVYFVATHELPMVDIAVMFDAGSSRDDQSFGLANLTNAMLDEGTAALSTDQIAERFANVGAQYSIGVSRDAASVNLRSLSAAEYLNPALDTFTTVLNNPSFPADSLQRLQQHLLQLVKEEQQTPEVVAKNQFFHLTYGEFPYGHAVIGNKNTIENFTREDCLGFYNTYYVANNATLAIVGDLSREQAERIATTLVGKLPSGQKPEALSKPDYDPETLQDHKVFPASQTSIYIGEQAIQRNDPRYFALHVGNYVLGGGGFVSRLFKEVRDTQGLTYHISSHFSPMRYPGPFTVMLQTRNGEADKAITLTKKILYQFIEEGPTDSEVYQAKRHIINAFPLHISNNNAILRQISHIGFYQLPLDYLTTYQQKINDTHLSDIKEAFKEVLHPKEWVTVTVGPSDKPAQVVTQAQATAVAVKW